MPTYRESDYRTGTVHKYTREKGELGYMFVPSFAYLLYAKGSAGSGVQERR